MNSAGLKPAQYGPLTGETPARAGGFAHRPRPFE
jgi:hypothetical protein